AAAALGHGDLLAHLGQIAQQVAAVAVEDQRARRHVDEEILGLVAVAVGPAAAAAGRRPPVFLVDDRRQTVGAGDGADDDAAAVAAVAAVGAALGDVFFAAKT